tara:strand:- start:41 stop:226 length:186 start_codon:yes stop_codon:yes gene_type:complete
MKEEKKTTTYYTENLEKRREYCKQYSRVNKDAIKYYKLKRKYNKYYLETKDKKPEFVVNFD